MTLNHFNASLAALRRDQRQQLYLRLAQTALAAYDLAAVTPIFLQHNAGVTYRIEEQSTPRYLLKLHVPAGSGVPVAVPLLEARLRWLAAVGQSTTLVVQVPVANRMGALLTSIAVAELAEPVWCSLQQWVVGAQVHGDFSTPQLTQLGVLLGTLHTASRHQHAIAAALPRFDVAWITECIEELRPAVALTLLTADEFLTIEQAGRQLQDVWGRTAPTSERWGAIHGDLHHGNVLFMDHAARPIDFDGLHVAPYEVDLGTTLYHIHYQGAAARQALLAGYRSTEMRADWSEAELDRALTWAALSNLAFQMSLPDQRTSAHLQRNLRQLASEFCPAVLAGRPIVAG